MSSVVFRQQIGINKSKLIEYLSEARGLERDVLGQEDGEQLECAISREILRIERVTNKLYTLSEKWLDFLKDLPEKIQGEERSRYEKWCTESEGFLEIAAKGEEALDTMKSRLNEVQKLLLKLEKKPGEKESQRLVQALSAQPALPRVELPKFSGNPLEWCPFWDAFRALVDSQNLAEVTKLSHLISCMTGTAKAALLGLPITNANYMVAVDILKKRFGDPDIVTRELYYQMHALPRCPNRVSEMRKFSEELEKLCRQLEANGENISAKPLILGVLQKLPCEVLDEMEKGKQGLNAWTMDIVRRDLQEYLRRKEEVLSLTQGGIGKSWEQKQSYHLRSKRDNEEDRGNCFTGLLTQSRDPASKCCELCAGPHFADECMKYANTELRYNRIAELKRCFRCMKEGHQSKNCRYNRACYYCKGPHHQALCEIRQNLYRRPINVPGNGASVRPRTERLDPMRPEGSHREVRRGEPQRLSLESHKMNSRAEPFTPKKQVQFHVNPVVDGQITGSMPEWMNPEAKINDDEHCYTNNEKLNEPYGRNFDGRDETIVYTEVAKKDEGDPKQIKTEVYLPIAQVELGNPNKPESVWLQRYALFDSGSQRSFVTTKLAKELDLETIANEAFTICTFANKKAKAVESNLKEIGVKLKTGKVEVLEVSAIPWLVKELTCRTWGHGVDEDGRKEMQKDELITPDILIGADYYWQMMGLQQIQKLDNNLFVVPSAVGNIISGKRGGKTDYTHNSTTIVDVPRLIDTQEHQAMDPLERFWQLESMGIEDSPLENENDKALQSFDKTVRFENGRYAVSWPWRERVQMHGDNYGLSLGRLKSLLRRLQKDRELMNAYQGNLKEQELQGIIEEVKIGSKPDGPIRYFPHQPVVTPIKNTTKLRIVFDASAKTSKADQSLNDSLFRGPVFLPDLCGILLRLRLQKIIVSADVEKAFLQLSLNKGDRDVTRFLWVRDPSKEICKENLQTYRFTRVAFGVISSPFLLAATIRHHLDKVIRESKEENNDNKNWMIELAEQIKTNTYVDNVFLTADDSSDATKKCKIVKEIFQSASMNLREWVSNEKVVNDGIPDTDRSKESPQKLLGLSWDPNKDEITIRLKKTSNTYGDCLTKREVLSRLAGHFDPLGILSPVLLRGKIYCQNLWKQGFHWDEILPPESEDEWKGITKEWDKFPEFSFPRYIGSPSLRETGELHAFVDASQHAYAAVIYLRTEEREKTHIEVLYAKNRLSPNKEITIPRLELMAILIGVRALKFAEGQLCIKFRRKIVWSDSRCALSWISSTKALPIFVANRVKEIKKDVSIEYRYVRGRENPADVASRGATATELANHSLWWRGPDWLQQEEELWPPREREYPPDEEEETLIYSMIQGRKPEYEEAYQILLEVAHRVSSWRKLKGVIAYMKRWTQRQKAGLKRTVFLRASELYDAERWIIEKLQLNCFQEINEAIEKETHQTMKDQLGIVKNMGILRCKGRYEKADLPADVRAPILLPSNHRITNLIVEEVHRINFHQGVQLTLCEVRGKWWIPKGRAVVRRVLGKCVLCKRYQGRPYPRVNMPPLPECRMTRVRPFKRCGLDYFGPIEVRIRQERKKIWGCLITCLITRAVHLEVVEDLTPNSFLNGLRRFVSRRGVPELIISDNASTFKSSHKITQIAWEVMGSERALELVTTKPMAWKFITSNAPWQGGFYERLVAMVKNCMKKSIGRRILTYDDFITLLCEIEAVINTRPLTYVYEDINAEIIRPVDFLIPFGDLKGPRFEEDETSSDDPEYQPERDRNHLLEIFKGTLNTLQKFWEVWKKEYLLSLREKQCMVHKGSPAGRNILPREGDMVVIGDEDLPRQEWRLGKIMALRVSEDGRIRAATVKTKNRGEIVRPIDALFPLEVPTDVTRDRPEAQKGKIYYKKDSNINLSVLLITIPLIACIMCTSQVGGIECRLGKGVVMTIPKYHECPEKVQDIVTSKWVSLAVRQYHTINATVCAMITREVCTKAFFRLYLSVTKDEIKKEGVSEHICRRLEEDGEYGGLRLEAVGVNRWRSNNPVSYSYGWLGEKCSLTHNFEVERGAIVYHDGSQLISTLAKDQTCKITTGVCSSKSHMIVWNGNNIGHPCQYKIQGRYRAEQRGNHMLIPLLQVSFVLTKNHTTEFVGCAFKKGYMTSQNDFIVILEEIQQNMTKRTQSLPTILVESDSLNETQDVENEKFQFLYDELREEWQETVKRNWEHICRHENLISGIIQWLSVVRPRVAAGILLSRHDVVKATRVKDTLITYCAGHNDSIESIPDPVTLGKTVVFNAQLIKAEDIQSVLLRAALETVQDEEVKASNKRKDNSWYSEVEQDLDQFTNDLSVTADLTLSKIEDELTKISRQWQLYVGATIGLVLVVALGVGYVWGGAWLPCRGSNKAIVELRQRNVEEPAQGYRPIQLRGGGSVATVEVARDEVS